MPESCEKKCKLINAKYILETLLVFKSKYDFSFCVCGHSFFLEERFSFFMINKCIFLREAGVTLNIYTEIYNSFFSPCWLFKWFNVVSNAQLSGWMFWQVQTDVETEVNAFVSKQDTTSVMPDSFWKEFYSAHD